MTTSQTLSTAGLLETGNQLPGLILGRDFDPAPMTTSPPAAGEVMGRLADWLASRDLADAELVAEAPNTTMDWLSRISRSRAARPW